MRTRAEIDRRLHQGQATVMVVEEAQQTLKSHGVARAVEQVEVVVTATFAPVSWALLFFRPALPATVQGIERAWLAGVPLWPSFYPQEMVLETRTHLGASAGSATRRKSDQSLQRGGAHLLEMWLAGERLSLRLQLCPDALPGQSFWEGSVGLSELEEARLLVVLRSLPQGRVAVNSRSQHLPSEFGLLLPEMGNAAYAWMGPWEPAVLDTQERAITPGLPVLLAGSVGHVAWRQGLSIAISTDVRSVRREYLQAVSIPGYGIGLAVGIAWPLTVLDAQVLTPLERPEERLTAEVLDYGATQRPYPRLGQVSYGDLLEGSIAVAGRQVPVTPISSRTRAARLAEDLKLRLIRREFPPLSPPEMHREEESS